MVHFVVTIDEDCEIKLVSGGITPELVDAWEEGYIDIYRTMQGTIWRMTDNTNELVWESIHEEFKL